MGRWQSLLTAISREFEGPIVRAVPWIYKLLNPVKYYFLNLSHGQYRDSF
jgi:hypothetical protein